MFKKNICIALSICLMLPLFSTVIFADSSDKSIKKIISIAYDDSGSMIWPNNNRKWAYASYSIQNLVGLIDKNDEISITKMSDPMVSEGIELTDDTQRQRKITSMEGWKPDINGHTPFESVRTATDWLKSKKEQYKDSRSVEYWLIVITDGEFETAYPQDMQGYLSEIKSYMGNSKYESIFVAIGDKVPTKVMDDWGTLAENHVIKASNSDTIVSAMSNVSGLILGQGGKEANITINQSSDRKSITFKSDFPLRKFIIFEQNQQVNIKSITSNEKSIDVTSSFSMKEPENNSTFSKIFHCQANDYIPAGEVTVTFESEINSSPTNLKIFTDAAVSVELSILDKHGETVDTNGMTLSEGDYIEFSALVTSCIDNKPIDLSAWTNSLEGEMIINNEKYPLIYNPKNNTFTSEYTLKKGSTDFLAIITLPGFFRTKSDILSIFPKNTITDFKANVTQSKIDVPYKFCNEYEEIGRLSYTVSGGAVSGMFDFHFGGIPKGITIQVDGVSVDENGKLSMKIHNDMPVDITLFRNKDYKETKESHITINVTTDQYSLKWKDGSIVKIILNPVQRKLNFDFKSTNDNLKVTDLDNKVIYTLVLYLDGEKISEEELETLNTTIDKELKGIVLKTEIAKNKDGTSVISIITQKGKGNAFNTQKGEIEAPLIVTTQYGESGKVTLKFQVDDDPSKWILPIVLMFLTVLIITLIILYAIKKRIDTKKHCFSVDGEDERIVIDSTSKWIPAVAHKGYVGEINLTAEKSKHTITVNPSDEMNNITVNGSNTDENEKEYTKERSFSINEDDELQFTIGKQRHRYIYKTIFDNFDDDNDDDDNYDDNIE